MTRSFVRPTGHFLLAIVGLTLSSAASQAQFAGFRSNYHYQPAFPTPYRFYSYQYSSISGYNSFGVPYSFYRYNSTVSPFPVNSFNNSNNYAPSYNHSSSSGSMTGGYGTAYDSSSPDLVRQRQVLQSAQNSAKWNPSGDPGPKNDLDTWLSDQSSRRDVNNPAQPALDIALINPNDEQLLSGLSLNELATRILALEAKGKKAAPGLCPPELVDKIVFTGGPAADALNIFHTSKIACPDIFNMPELSTLLEAFEKTYAPIATTAQSGKKALPADIDRLQSLLEKAKSTTEPMLKPAPIKEAKALLAFYASLESGLKYLKTDASVGVVGDKWNSIGVNVSDLVKHLRKFQIRFGRASAGDDAAYGSLHRGMLAYYAALSQAK